MRLRSGSPRADLTDTVVVDDDAETATRGAVVGLLTLPFRLVGGLVRAVLLVVRAVIAIVMIPITLAVFAVVRIVRLAADLVYGVWRLLVRVLGLLVAILKGIVVVLDRTVGALIRTVLRAIGAVLRALVWTFSLGRFAGAKKAKADRAASEPGETVVDLAA